MFVVPAVPTPIIEMAAPAWKGTRRMDMTICDEAMVALHVLIWSMSCLKVSFWLGEQHGMLLLAA